MSRSISFPTRLGRYIITAASILFLLTMGILAWFAVSAGKKQAVENSDNVLQTAISDINGLLSSVESAAASTVWVIKEHMDDPDYMYTITSNLVKDNEIIIGSAVAFEANYFPEKGEYFAPYSCQAGEDGEIDSFQLGSNENDYFSSDWYILPMLLGQTGWSEPYFDAGGAEQMMTTYSIPVQDETGRTVAILTADVSLEGLTQIISDLSLYENSYTVLIGNSGAFISHWDPEKLLNSTIFSTALEMKSDKVFEIGQHMVNGDSGYGEFISESGKDSFISYGALSNGWSAGVISEYRDVFASSRKLNFILILAICLGIALLYFIVWKMIRRLTQPITEFVYSAQAIAKGNFKARIPEVQTNDELKRLQESLVYMEKSVDNYITELRTTTAANEKMGRELSIASSIQMHMLSHNFPQTERVDLHATLHPAKEVGGDLYDFYLDGDKLYFVVGDVSGKGVPAALFMAITRSLFQYIVRSKYDIKTVISRINDAVSDGNESNMFVTMFGGCIDLNTYEMEFCNAGHNPIVIIDPDGKAEYLHAKANIAAGLFGGFPYAGEKRQLSKGSRLIVYTDGVSEAETKEKVLFGEDRLLAFADGKLADSTSGTIVDGLLNSVRAFTDGNEQNDDITIMSVLLK